MVKAQRVAFFAAHGVVMGDAEVAAAHAAAGAPLAAVWGRPLRLLDVGSNHNPFQHHAHFQVRAGGGLRRVHGCSTAYNDGKVLRIG